MHNTTCKFVTGEKLTLLFVYGVSACFVDVRHFTCLVVVVGGFYIMISYWFSALYIQSKFGCVIVVTCAYLLHSRVNLTKSRTSSYSNAKQWTWIMSSKLIELHMQFSFDLIFWILNFQIENEGRTSNRLKK